MRCALWPGMHGGRWCAVPHPLELQRRHRLPCQVHRIADSPESVPGGPATCTVPCTTANLHAREGAKGPILLLLNTLLPSHTALHGDMHADAPSPPPYDRGVQPGGQMQGVARRGPHGEARGGR